MPHLIFFFKQKTAYEISACLVGSEMCIRDRPGGGSGRKFLWELPESWKRLRLPAMTKNTRRFVLAFGLTLGVVLLIVAAAGIYRWGYNGAIAEKGTYDAGFAAAMAERGTYQEGYDAAIAEKGTYDDGYTAGFAKGKTEGYEEGYAAGHEDGSSEGYDAGYDSGTSDAAQSAAEAEKNTRVWVSKRLGSRYHSSPDCPLVIKPKEMTRQEAEDEGYTSCDWCW